jgi:hypothetical protein
MGRVRVSARNGRLVPVTAVTRVLPRQWDGRRLLRFLTGLAMLALAFTVHATPPVPAPAISAAPPPVAVASSVAPTAPEAVSAEPVAALPVLPALPAGTPVVIGAAVLLLFPVGRLLSVRAERAPPLA